MSYAVFTLGRNMFSLIMNETCFTVKIVHNRRCISNRDRNVFILSVIETTSRGFSFNHAQNQRINHFGR